MSPQNLITHCTDILLRCMRGLALPPTAYKGTANTPDGIVCWFQHEDGKLYRLEIKEAKYGIPKDDAKTE